MALGNDKREDKCFIGAQFHSVNTDGKADWALNLFGGNTFKNMNMLSVGLIKGNRLEHTPCGKDVQRGVMSPDSTPHVMQAAHWWEVYTQRSVKLCINKCEDNSCSGKGVCENEPSINELQGFSCTCDEGWYGDRCQLKEDKCKDGKMKCLNGGTCSDSTCACPTGWIGDFCEEDVDDCVGNTECQNGGICVDGINSITCSCLETHYGDRCESQYDACYMRPCMK